MAQPLIGVDLTKRPHSKTRYEEDEALALFECAENPLFFMRNYMRVQHPTKGAVAFEPFPFQEEMVQSFEQNRFSICMTARQMGKSTVATAYLLWKAMFHPDTTILICANKYDMALELMHRIRYAYENLPDHIRAGVTEYNKGSITFDNGSRIVSRATTKDSARGLSVTLCYVDEFAFVPPNKAKEFWTSIRPTLATGGSCIVTSTPQNDEDQFAQIWKSALDNTDEFGNPNPDGLGKNGFKALCFPWTFHPEREQKWADEERASLGDAKFRQEHCCEFVSSDETLINPLTLIRLKGADPLFYVKTMRWYEEPEPNHAYVVALDPSLGTGGNYSAIQVFKLPQMSQVAEWRHNHTDTRGQILMLLQTLLFLDGTLRDDPHQRGEPDIYWTVENNSLGEAALLIIEDTGEDRFPGLFVSERRRKGVARGRFRKGMTTTASRKLAACARLKSLVESDRMKINSALLIRELKNFVGKQSAFSAKPGETDDLVSATLLSIRALDVALYWGASPGNLREIISDDELEDESSGEPLPMVV